MTKMFCARDIVTTITLSIGIVLAILLPSKSESFRQKRLAHDTDKPTSARFLANACASTDPAAVEYCKGYVESAGLFLKTRAACSADDPDERLFCAGVEEAHARIIKFFDACSDCNGDSFRPDLEDRAAWTSLFVKRMRKFTEEMREALETCPKEKHGNKQFCSGYEAQIANEIASLTVSYFRESMIDPAALGRGDAAAEIFPELYASQEIHRIQTCITSRTLSLEMRDALVEFVHRYPDQIMVDTGIKILSRALHYTFCEGAERSRPHMEECLEWTYKADEFVAENRCATPIFVQFMAKSQSAAIAQEVAAGDIFHTGLSEQDVNSGWRMFSACPPGYTISIPFEANSRDITASLYDCRISQAAPN